MNFISWLKNTKNNKNSKISIGRNIVVCLLNECDHVDLHNGLRAMLYSFAFFSKFSDND